MSDNVLMNEQGAASHLGLSPRTLQMWRFRGKGPRFVRISCRCVRYRKADLEKWIDEKAGLPGKGEAGHE